MSSNSDRLPVGVVRLSDGLYLAKGDMGTFDTLEAAHNAFRMGRALHLSECSHAPVPCIDPDSPPMRILNNAIKKWVRGYPLSGFSLKALNLLEQHAHRTNDNSLARQVRDELLIRFP